MSETPFELTPERVAYLIQEAYALKVEIQANRLPSDYQDPELNQIHYLMLTRINQIIIKLEIIYDSIRKRDGGGPTSDNSTGST